MDHSVLTILDLGIITAYLVIMVLVGVYSVRRIQNTKDYYVAGRSFGPMVLMATVCATIIGGSGLDNLNIFTNARDTFTGTVWGEPSSPLREGEIAGIPVAVLARHGRSHTIAPSSVNYRANIQALKDAGCTHILATTATGSLRKEIRRGDLVILDQFIDFTKQRKMTFHDYFKPGQPVHAPMAEPFDASLRQILIDGVLMCEVSK